ncbi:sugar phosphate isomerase/epimerase [Nocardiopsis sp. MG754419]|nr:sugar phosphate isomerase/epimerase [Nocardiopsis sp. MG754419]
MLHDTASLGADVFQICDYPPLEAMDEGEFARIRATARDLGLILEVGTRGVAPDHLRRFLDIAAHLGATFVRSMITPQDLHSEAGVPAMLTDVLPEYAERGVELGLETYEQLSTRALVDIVESVDDPALGIVLDPANCVARLEHPSDVVEMTAPHVNNLHVKDFVFGRSEGWVGFTLTGCPLGEGLLDHDLVLDRVRPERRGINQVIEHWLPWAGDATETTRIERQWTRHNLDRLRSTNS